MFITEKNNSNQDIAMVGPNGFLRSFKETYLVLLIDILWSF